MRVMRLCTAAVDPLREDLHPIGDAPVTRREVCAPGSGLSLSLLTQNAGTRGLLRGLQLGSGRDHSQASRRQPPRIVAPPWFEHGHRGLQPRALPPELESHAHDTGPKGAYATFGPARGGCGRHRSESCMGGTTRPEKLAKWRFLLGPRLPAAHRHAAGSPRSKQPANPEGRPATKTTEHQGRSSSGRPWHEARGGGVTA